MPLKRVAWRTGANKQGAQRPPAQAVGSGCEREASTGDACKSVKVSRSSANAVMRAVPLVGTAFLPLDKELDVLTGGLTPHAQQCLIRLSAWMPFAHAAQMLFELLGIHISRASARRCTLRAGEKLEQMQTDQAHPQATDQKSEDVAGTKRLAMSTDGAFVPVVGGEWVEVKTLVIGEVQETGRLESEAGRHTCNHSSFSRVADAISFTELASYETARRGVEQAIEVAAVQDGAEWLQGFVDGHRPNAVRILDFAHAATYVHGIGEAARLAGIKLPARWREIILHQLKHTDPGRVLAHLVWLVARVETAEAQAKLAYLQKREAQMQYPRFQLQGWPIGSGMVGSANKLVVEARLKGAGMYWKPCHLNPMLALRN